MITTLPELYKHGNHGAWTCGDQAATRSRAAAHSDPSDRYARARSIGTLLSRPAASNLYFVRVVGRHRLVGHRYPA